MEWQNGNASNLSCFGQWVRRPHSMNLCTDGMASDKCEFLQLAVQRFYCVLHLESSATLADNFRL